ncbi:iron-sulfur cluster assembly scaffold protein [Qipengyuania sp. DY56-A-20]|jgi:NifU-like protein involved in Fe-S cluster formation|uniref:Iron-sulfur cluster assembly scaffold protein n=1 Tax=Qipengyuania benthica TaxID=3067651 RepID=A0ABT9H7D7_9SPHN|nr:iron-sulfur cluster assembly scaffold protein [Qipengyuania sp. DY56-A-20]MDP4539233.1 iron-sulfur cluster assembly scaffold protein [Qipengyuania sp. DY56-A-20]
MRTSSTAVLYSPALLGLAVDLADYPLTDRLTLHGEARSRSCGSTLALGCTADEDGAIAEIGMRVSACAVGQAAAAIFVRQAHGRDAASLKRSLAGVDGWLAGCGDRPAWPGLEALDPALPHAGRHEAIRLPWRAALAALSNLPAAR